LIALLHFVLAHPDYPIIAAPDNLVVGSDKKADVPEEKVLAALQIAFDVRRTRLAGFVSAYAAGDRNQALLRQTVNRAVSAHGQMQPYFERLSEEDVLYRFFESPQSPLINAHLIPFVVHNRFDSVAAWIESAVAVVAKFEGTGTFERRMVLSILVTRFLFDRTFPQFDFRQQPEPLFIRKMSVIAQTVAHIDTEQQAIDWMDMSQWVTCPFDAAYCLHMVLVALEMPGPGDDSDAYFAAMAQHSLSIEVLLAVLCRSIVANPRGFIEYLKSWSALTGFSGRCVAAISFFESAVEMIEEVQL
jgi:hypothetical protein